MATILIAGGTGLIGKRLTALLAREHEVRLLSRHPEKVKKFAAYYWDPMKEEMNEEALQDVDYVINLAGAGIADKRWTPQRKKLIIESRTKGAALFVKKFKTIQKPKAYIAASAIGYYGNRGNELLIESSSPGNGFLSESVVAWESASQEMSKLGIPTYIIRIGIVLSTEGGALAKMLPSYKFKIGSYFGNGAQIYSWIHIEDAARIFKFIVDSNISPGIINAVAPNPVSNKSLAQEINIAGNYGALVMPAPSFALKLALGEMSHVVLDGAHVSSQKLQDINFKFKWPVLNEALKDLLS